MTPEKLRELYGEPMPRAAAKVITTFDRHCRDFIANSSFALVATSDGSDLDISPKGDPAGFVEVESDTSLLIPDRPGNNRIDGMLNLLRNPKVALLFMIPTVGETLRVKGTAEILDAPEICDRFQINGRSPKTVLRITAEKIFLHCGKAPMRAGLWKPATWPETRPVASLNTIMAAHADAAEGDPSQSAVEDAYRKALY